MKPIFLACFALFALAMLCAHFAAHAIVDAYGLTGTLVTLGAMYLAAHYWERC